MPLGKLLPQLVSGCCLEILHQAVNAELRITAHQQLPVIGQHFQLDKGLPPSFNELGQQLLESRSDCIDQDVAPILGANTS